MSVRKVTRTLVRTLLDRHCIEDKMKKLFSRAFMVVSAFIIVFTLSTCVDPIMGFFNTVYKGWPVDYLEEYGIGDLGEEPADSRGIEYKFEDGNLIISFTGSEATSEELYAYLSTWNPNPDMPESNEYIRGISYLVLDDAYKPYYEISVEKDPGVAGMPPDGRLFEYHVEGLAVAENTAKITHAIDITRDPYGVPKGFQLTIMIYNEEEAGFDSKILNFLDNLSIWEIQQEDEYRPGFYMYATGPMEINFDTRSKPYYYEIDISKDLGEDETIGWPDDITLGQFGLFGLMDLIDYGATDVTYQIIPYGSDDDEEAGGDQLILRFYGATNGWTEASVMAYFNQNTWKPDEITVPTILNYDRGPASASFDITYKSYYELGSTIKLGTKYGWPKDDLRSAYGIENWKNPPSEAINATVTHFIDTSEEDDSLYIWFLGDSGTSAKVKGKEDDYFNKTWCPEESLEANITEYSRGAYFGSLNEGSRPFFEMVFTKNSEVIEGWPQSAMLTKYGITDMAKPEGADYISHYESTEIDPDTNLEETKLIIKYYGESETIFDPVATGLFQTWRPEEQITVLTNEYSRVNFNGSLNMGIKPYYEIEIGENREFQPGWPTTGIRPQYGISEWTAPGNTEYWAYSIDDTDGSLTIRFRGTTAFNFKDFAPGLLSNPSNSWWPEGQSETEPSVFEYSRGVYISAFDTNFVNGYCDIVLTKNEEIFEGWPLGTAPGNKRDAYGFNGPNEGVWNNQPSNTNYITYTDDPAEGLTIRFYSTYLITSKSVSNSTGNYFNNTWEWEDPVADEQTGEWPEGIDQYIRGGFNAEFNSNEAPYYEFNFTKRTDCETGWPNSQIRDKYDLAGTNEAVWNSSPTNTDYITYTDDPAEGLTIRFYSSALLDGSTVSNSTGTYFNTTWFAEELTPDDITGELPVDVNQYSRGGFNAEFDYAGSPYYEMSFTQRTDCTPKWPDSTVRGKYGLSAWNNPPTGAEYITYVDDPVEGLSIKFHGNSGTLGSIQSSYLNNTWFIEEPEEDEETHEWPDPRITNYSRGGYNAELSAIDEPYYEMTFTENTENTTWPSNLFESYGLHGLSSGKPSDIDYQIFTEENPQSNSRNLTIRYYAASSNNTIRSYLVGVANNWSVIPPSELEEPLEPGAVAYGRGYTQAILTPIQNAYYELDISFEIPSASPSVPGWPTSYLAEFDLAGYNQPVNSIYPAYEYYPDPGNGGDDEKSLIMMFYRAEGVSDSTFETAINTVLASSWTYDAESSTAEILEYNKPGYFLSFTVGSRPYYEIEACEDTSVQKGWPTASVWANFGLTVSSAAPANTSNIVNTYDETYKDSLEVKFIGTGTATNLNTLEAVIKSYFSTWNALNAASPFEYSKGKWDATFTTGTRTGSGTLTAEYTIEISLKDNCEIGWPGTSILNKYGIGSAPGNATDIGYSVSGDDILIWFSGTTGISSGTTESQARKLFDDWRVDSTNNTTSNPGEYSRGLYEASLTIKSGYFEIEISPNADSHAWGSPAPINLSTYRLGSGTMPAVGTNGITSVGYINDVDAVIIWFIGNDNTEAVLKAWLTTNGWQADTTTGNTVEYYSLTPSPEKNLDFTYYGPMTNNVITNKTYYELAVDK